MSDPGTFRYLGVDLDLDRSTVSCRYRLGAEEFVELAAARWKGTTRTGPGATLLRSFWSSSRCKVF